MAALGMTMSFETRQCRGRITSDQFQSIDSLNVIGSFTKGKKELTMDVRKAEGLLDCSEINVHVYRLKGKWK